MINELSPRARAQTVGSLFQGGDDAADRHGQRDGSASRRRLLAGRTRHDSERAPLLLAKDKDLPSRPPSVESVPASLSDGEQPMVGSFGMTSLYAFAGGVATFSVVESIVIQSQLFASCFRYGPNAYAISVGALFLPGVLVMLAQNRYDLDTDQRHGTRQAATARLAVAHVGQLVLLCVLLALLHAPGSRLVGSAAMLSAVLVPMGICCSLGFGTYSQIIAILPSKCSAFYFMGISCVFAFMGPVNAAVGELCPLNMTQAMGYTDPSSPVWSRVAPYYAAAGVLNVLGLGSFLALVRSEAGRHYFAEKDKLLQSGSRSRMMVSVIEEGGEWGESKGLANGHGLEPQPEELSYAAILWRVWKQSLTQSMTLMCSLVVAAELINVPVETYANLGTILLYVYYVSLFCGVLLTLFRRLRQASENVLLAVAIVRVLFVVAFFLYLCGVITYRNDYMVMVVYSVFMIVGGFLFSVVFAQAVAKFEDATDRSRAATLQNIVYFVVMAISIVWTLTGGKLIAHRN